MSMETRSFNDMDLEVRSTGDGRTICGILVPYNVEQRIHASLTEVFRKGAFADVIRAAHRVKLLSGHETRKFPLGRATMLREDESGLYGELKISKTRAGDEALELIRDGALDQLSIGFQPLKDSRRKDGVVERLKAHLAEVSLVTFGAYGDLAAVSAVRDMEETPNMAAARAILEGLKK